MAFEDIPRSVKMPAVTSAAPCKADDRPKTPSAAPATRMPSGSTPPGTNARISSFQTGLPRWWQVRWTVGFHPPDTARQSVVIFRPFFKVIDESALRPAVSIIRPPVMTSVPYKSGGLTPSRTSINARTVTPLAIRSLAVRQPSSLLVKTVTFFPGATPKRLT